MTEMQKKPQKQVMRFDSNDLSLMKNTFAENEDLLKSIRKVFLQMFLSDADKERIAGSFKSKDNVLALIRKVFLPTLDGDAPIHQMVDLYQTIKVDEKGIEDTFPILVARTKLIALLEQQLNVLGAVAEGKEVDTDINLASLVKIEGKDAINAYADWLCRNTLVAHTDTQLAQINILAGMKEESTDQTMARLAKDSSK